MLQSPKKREAAFMSKSLFRRLLCIAAAVMILSAVSAAFAEGWVCPKCGRENPEKANFCGECRTEKPAAQVAPESESNAWICANCSSVCPDSDKFCVYCGGDRHDDDARALLIQPAERKSTAWPQAEIVRMSDSIRSEQEKTYRFTAPVEGRYCLFLEECRSGFELSVSVLDALGERVDYAYLSGEAGSCLPLELPAGTYTVRAEASTGEGSYTLCVGIANPVRDAAGFQVLGDSIVFERQVNRYTFTAPEDGKYGVWFTDIAYGIELRVEISDSLGYQTDYAYLTGESSLTVTLEAGKEYIVFVEQSLGLGAYTLNLGMQKPELAISGLVAVRDELGFNGQVNAYRFQPQTSGTYVLKLTGADSGFMLRADFYDENGWMLDYMLLSKGDSMSVTLEAANEYVLTMGQDTGTGGYTFTLTR